MEKIKLLCTLLSLIAVLCGCQGKNADPLAYASRSFSCLILWEEEGMECKAQMDVSPPSTGASRDLTVTFFAPSAMEGLTLTRTQGKTTMQLGEQTILHPSLEKWLRVPLLMLAEGEKTGKERQAQKNENAIAVTIQGQEGETTILIDPQTLLPTAIRTSTVKLQVLSFSYIT